MKTIGVIANLKKEQAVESIRRVSELARGMGFTVYVESRAETRCPSEQTCPVEFFAVKGVEAVAVLGGDGTMLDAAHRTAGQNLPLMGLNIGSLGYLTSVEEQRFGDALKLLRDGGFTVSHRSALEVSVERANANAMPLPDALNDVVLNRGTSGHAVKIDLLLSNQLVASVLCDGVIVATPTGSTAYSLSAGGPILLPDTPAIVISVICPHTLTSRPLVVRDNAEIKLRAASCESPLVVCSDGRNGVPLLEGESVSVTRSPRGVSLIELDGYSPCDVLRRKLKWGGR